MNEHLGAAPVPKLVLRADLKGHTQMLVALLNWSRESFGWRDPFAGRLGRVVAAFESFRLWAGSTERAGGVPELRSAADVIPLLQTPVFVLRADLPGHLRMIVQLLNWARGMYGDSPNRNPSLAPKQAAEATSFVRQLFAVTREFEIYQEVRGGSERMDQRAPKPPAWPT